MNHEFQDVQAGFIFLNFFLPKSFYFKLFNNVLLSPNAGLLMIYSLPCIDFLQCAYKVDILIINLTLDSKLLFGGYVIPTM